MNLEKLQVGMIVKNYKELCMLLSVKTKTGCSKQTQLKEFERYFKYHKDGNKFIIDEIYDKPKELIENRGGKNQVKYIKNIELLVLDLLAQANNGEVFLSKNKLLRALNMINDNYVFCKRRIPKLSKFMEIEQTTVEEWYDSTDGMLKRNLEKALDGLRNQALAIWSSAMTVCQVITNEEAYGITKETRYDEYDEEIIEYKIGANYFLYREATKEEKQFILHTEKEIMESLSCENKQEIIRNGLWEEFNKQVDEIVLSKLKIAFYYDSYKILFNEDHVQEKQKSINLLLEKKEREEEQEVLNDSIIERLKENIEKKQDRAKENVNDDKFNNLNEKKKSKLLMRTKDNYLNDNNNLINTLIHDKTKTIKEKVRKTIID